MFKLATAIASYDSSSKFLFSSSIGVSHILLLLLLPRIFLFKVEEFACCSAGKEGFCVGFFLHYAYMHCWVCSLQQKMHQKGLKLGGIKLFYSFLTEECIFDVTLQKVLERNHGKN